MILIILFWTIFANFTHAASISYRGGKDSIEFTSEEVGDITNESNNLNPTLPNNSSSFCINKVDGFYADIPSNCSQFHYCQTWYFPGGENRTNDWLFNCPLPTIFNQEFLTCTPGYLLTFHCEDSAQYFDRNHTNSSSSLSEDRPNAYESIFSMITTRNPVSNPVISMEILNNRHENFKVPADTYLIQRDLTLDHNRPSPLSLDQLHNILNRPHPPLADDVDYSFVPLAEHIPSLNHDLSHKEAKNETIQEISRNSEVRLSEPIIFKEVGELRGKEYLLRNADTSSYVQINPESVLNDKLIVKSTHSSKEDAKLVVQKHYEELYKDYLRNLALPSLNLNPSKKRSPPPSNFKPIFSYRTVEWSPVLIDDLLSSIPK